MNEEIKKITSFVLMKVEIDKKSGFCFGVVYAIGKAEDALEESKSLYCLGDIVHNQAEVERLQAKGLTTINHEQFKKLRNVLEKFKIENKTVTGYDFPQK